MKRFLLFLMAATAILCSCEKKDQVESTGTYQRPTEKITPGETKVQFSIMNKAPLSVIVRDQSENVSTIMCYDMGDGSKVIQKNPGEKFVYRYSKAGQYIITATAATYQMKAQKTVTINTPSIYVIGLRYDKVDESGKYYWSKLNDDGPLIVYTKMQTNYTPSLNNSSLPYTISFTNPALLDNPSKHSYYTLYVYWNDKQSGKGTQCLKQDIQLYKFLAYPDYIDVHNNSGNTQVRLIMGYTNN